MRQVKKPVAVMVNAKLQRTSKVPVERYRIHVIDRAAQILDCFGFDHQELSVSEIGAKTGLHRSTAHRILMALEYNDLIKQNPSTGKYHLGIKLFKLGHQAVSQLNLRDICRPFLSRLMNDTKETIHLAVLDDDQVLYLDKVEGPHALRMPSRVGRYIPTYCTSLGKAMLSCLDDQEVKSILRRQTLKPHTENTVKNINQLLADLGSVRKRGYAVDNEEIEIGLRCVGAPLRDYTGGMVGAISVAAPSARLSEKNTPVIGRMVIAIAAGISQKLGFEKPKTAQAQ
jgi:DNA-binding IclR family transcriptional regulator